MLALCALGSCDDWGFVGVGEPLRVRVTLARSSIRVGESTTIIGEAYREMGEPAQRVRQDLAFLSSDPGVATVVGRGSATVTGVAAGAAWMVGEMRGVRDSVRITVTP
jgi:uncharacterized protein YjdB